MDTIGSLPEVMTFKFIIIFIDTFTRYVELFPANTVCAISAANDLWKHICRFCTPLEILTDQGRQFMNQTLTHLASISGIKHHVTIPYSKEDWPQMLCMTEKHLNKEALGLSPDTLLFGDAISTEQS